MLKLAVIGKDVSQSQSPAMHTFLLHALGEECSYEAVSIPVIGMGGVRGAEDVIEMMLAGATAVEVWAANLVEPYACRDIVAALPATMEKYGIANLSDIIGKAH